MVVALSGRRGVRGRDDEYRTLVATEPSVPTSTTTSGASPTR
ncbi:hypothetical protein [Streptomyces phaeochromogenes]